MATQESLDRVQQLYVAYYGRPADQEGQEYWADRLDAEGEGAIINAFGNSEEYAAKAEGQGNATLIDAIYQQAFNRKADPEGLAYYAGVLERGEKTLAEIATTIINAAGGQDRQVLNARVEAATEYTTEFGAAADYDLEAAKAVISETDGGVYVPVLTSLVEDYLAALEARDAFLTEADGDDDENTSATRGELETDRDNAQTALNALESENQLNADLQDAQDALQAANDDIAEVAGLRKEIADYQAAQEATEAAIEADVNANAELQGEITAFNNRNAGDVVVAANGVVTLTQDSVDYEVITLNNDDELVIDQDLIDANSDLEVEGLEALLADIQANLAAEEALADAQEAEADALVAVQALEEDNGAVTGETPLLDALVAAQGQVEDAETALEERSEAAAELAEAQELVDQLDALDEAITNSEEAIADEDVDLDDAAGADVETDLFVFDAEAGTTTDGASTVALNGEDLFFIGEAFTRVDLEEGDDVLTDTAFGRSDTLEVFFQQNGTGVDLFFENASFQGSATNGFEGDTITLTGVSIEDVQLENGYITIA
jgi:hypothetical protein